MPETLSNQVPSPAGYPHHTAGLVTAEQVSAHLARHPSMYPPILDDAFRENGITVDRSVEHPYAATDGAPLFEQEAIEAVEEGVDSHNWGAIEAQPHTPSHRALEYEIGQDISPGFGALSSSQQEALAVSALIGDTVVTPPAGRLSRMANFFKRLGRRRPTPDVALQGSGGQYDPATTERPTEVIPNSMYGSGETTPASGWAENSDISWPSHASNILSEAVRSHEQEQRPQTLTEYAAKLETLINKAASEHSDNSEGGKAMQAFLDARRNIIWYPEDNMGQILKSGNYSPKELSALLGTARHATEFALDGYRQKLQGGQVGYHSALQLLDQVPTESVRAAYFSAADNERGNLRYMLRADAANDNVAVAFGAVEKLARIHGCSASELFSSPIVNSDPIVQSISQRKDFYKVMVESVPGSPRYGEKNADYVATARTAETEYLKLLGIPEELSSHIRQSIDSRTMAKDKHGDLLTGEERSINGLLLKKTLANLEENIQAIGLENALELPETCGIVSFGDYTAQQLERMLKFARGDSELLADLRAGDVTVAFIDRRGDHNGSMSTDAEKLEKPSGRTLFFEINKPEDFGRYSQMLIRNRVKPSTATISAHGRPGSMFVGDIFNGGFILTNADPEQLQEAQAKDGIRRVPMQAEAQSKFLTAFARNVMQESRGIDDDSESAGRRKLVLLSCSQAVDREITQNGEVRHASTATTLAETFTRSGAGVVLDVYAGDAVIKTVSTDDGLKYEAKQSDKTYKGVPVQKLTATGGDQVGRKEGGQVTRTEVAEIKLRRPPHSTRQTTRAQAA